ncbi:RNA polymerase subunit sigma-24 [Clostridioides difficile]|nr:RNA polymerase subunit sigma-24 [Clostridioides difficile]
MKTINLKDYYDHISTDTFIDIPDEVFNIFEEHHKAEQAYQSRIRYHKTYYSLDRGDGIELRTQAHNRAAPHAIATLPDKQAKRIYAHYFLGMSKTSIAKAEGTSASSVKDAIRRGLCSLEKYLKNNL